MSVLSQLTSLPPRGVVLRRRALVAAALALGLVLALAVTGAAGAQEGEVEILVHGNRADLLSGGDALLEVVLPAGADAATLQVDVDGRDVSDAVVPRPDGRVLGLVEGLAVGENVVTAEVADGRGRGSR